MSEKLSFLVELKQSVDTELNKIKQSVSDTKSTVSSMLGGMKSAIAAAFTVTAVAQFGRSILDYVGRIKDASAATGISTTNFQALSMVARENGVEMDSLVMQLGRLRDIQGSIGSNTQLQETFSRLGMSVDEVRTADPDALLQQIARSIRDTGDASAAFDIFGRNAAKLIPVLNELADGWDSLVAKTKSGIISERDIENIDRMGDTLDNAGTKAKAFGALLIGGVEGISALAGRMSTGKGLLEAGREEGQSRNDEKKSAEAKKAQEKALKEQLAQKEKAAQEAKELDKASAEGAGLGEQWAKANMSAKNYEARLQERVNALVIEANREGLTALERQLANNEALKASLSLLEAQKRVKDEADKETEKKRQDDEKKQRESDHEKELTSRTEEKMSEYRLSKQDPNKQLASVELGIKRNQEELNSGKASPKRRAELVDSLIEGDKKRESLKKDISAASEKTMNASASRADQIKDAQENISKARQRREGSAGLGDVFTRMYDIKAGRTNGDDAARQTADNTRIIAENTNALKALMGTVQ